MNFERLELAWQSAANTPSDAAQIYLMSELHDNLKRKRDDVRGLLVFAGVALMLPVVLAVFDYSTGRGDPIDFSREWGLVPFLLIPVAVWALVWLRQRAHLRAHPAIAAPLRDTFRALLDENAAARDRIHIIAGAYLLLAPALALMINQLGAVGKMEPAHMVQAGIIMGVGLCGGAIYMALKYALQLLPERRRLEALIRQYDGQAG